MRVEAKPRKIGVQLANGEVVAVHAESWILALLDTLPVRQREAIVTKAMGIEKEHQTRRDGIFLPNGAMSLTR